MTDAPEFVINTFMRKGSNKVAGGTLDTFCGLQPSQPLLLHREPGNPKDASAVRLTTVTGQPCGYVAREQAGEVAAVMDAGAILLARVNGYCICFLDIRPVLIWSEGETVHDEDEQEAPRQLDKVFYDDFEKVLMEFVAEYNLTNR